MRAKKSLGQHFLRSARALDTIIDAGDPNAGDLILEIGPGEGILTEKLIFLAGKVVAVEKDDLLYAALKSRFEREIKLGKLDLIHGDILDFNPETLRFYDDLDYKIIANIPYNITGAIFEKFLSADFQPERMVLLVQKEVAERIVARDGKESILSISVKAYGRPVYIEKVKAGSFVPTPKVDSAILLVEGISKEFFKGFSEKEFFKMLRTGFQSKRKKLVSNLSALYEKTEVEKVFRDENLNENVRAEDLSLENWRNIAKKLLTNKENRG